MSPKDAVLWASSLVAGLVIARYFGTTAGLWVGGLLALAVLLYSFRYRIRAMFRPGKRAWVERIAGAARSALDWSKGLDGFPLPGMLEQDGPKARRFLAIATETLTAGPYKLSKASGRRLFNALRELDSSLHHRDGRLRGIEELEEWLACEGPRWLLDPLGRLDEESDAAGSEATATKRAR